MDDPQGSTAGNHMDDPQGSTAGNRMDDPQGSTAVNHMDDPQGSTAVNHMDDPQGSTAGNRMDDPQGSTAVNHMDDPQGSTAVNHMDDPQGSTAVNHMDDPQGSTAVNHMDDPQGSTAVNHMDDPQGSTAGNRMDDQHGSTAGNLMGGDPPGSDADKLEFYPSHMWGMDPHFHVANKMYITDILHMPEHPLASGAFTYKNHPIYKVDVMGTVVMKSQNSKCHMYKVDDGTGVITCSCWKTNTFGKPEEFSASSLPACLQAKCRELKLSQQEDTQGYSLGDYIHIKGKVKIYQGQKEILAYYHTCIEDPMVQVTRLLELPLLYTKHHDVPWSPPRHVAETLNLTGENKAKPRPETFIVEELKAAIDNHITTDTSIDHLLIDDLIHVPKVKDILSQLGHGQNGEEKRRSLLVQALTPLAELGHVVRRNDNKQMYEVLLHKSIMEEMVLKILKRDVNKPKCAEKGCHYFHVREMLRRTHQYAGVQTRAVQYCLSKLEEKSLIVGSTDAHYIAI